MSIRSLARLGGLPLATAIFAGAAFVASTTPAHAATCLTCGGDGGGGSVPAPRPVPTPKAATPTSPAVSNVTSHSATVSWTDTTRDESSFTITRYAQATPSATASTLTVTVPATSATTYTLSQSDLPANQTVWWSIVANASGKAASVPATAGTLTVDLPSSSPVLPQLQAFRADWAPNAFPWVGKGAVLADVVGIVADPRHRVNQGHTGACGPAAVETELLRADPGRFVDTLRSLVDTGAFTTPDGTTYAAHQPLLTSGPNPTVTPANWLFMATLKDSGNSDLSRITGAVDGNDSAWISSPADVDNWLSHVIGLHTTTATAIVRPFTWGANVMPTAWSVHQNGGAVVLLIDDAFVGNPGIGFSVPDHYVDLLGWSVDPSGLVHLSVETWGGQQDITTDWNTFDGEVWDVLTAS